MKKSGGNIKNTIFLNDEYPGANQKSCQSGTVEHGSKKKGYRSNIVLCPKFNLLGLFVFERYSKRIGIPVGSPIRTHLSYWQIRCINNPRKGTWSSESSRIREYLSTTRCETVIEGPRCSFCLLHLLLVSFGLVLYCSFWELYSEDLQGKGDQERKKGELMFNHSTQYVHSFLARGARRQSSVSTTYGTSLKERFRAVIGFIKIVIF